jgi:hypothetical protein
MPIGFQILNQAKLVEKGVESVKEVISQLVTEGQFNLGLLINILRTNGRFQRGIMLPKFGNRRLNMLIM